jgi:hypothetical protein
MKEQVLQEVIATMDRLMTTEEILEFFENILGEMSEERLVNILAEVRANYI